MAKLAISGGKPIRTKPYLKDFPVFEHLVEKEIDAVTRVVRSHNLNALNGCEVKNFEAAYAQYMGIKHAIAVSSGTTALHVALAALDIGVGDEVIVPPYTMLATGSSVLMQNAIPIFADIDPKNVLGFDLENVKKRITSRTKAIIPVHVNGYPQNMDGLMALAKENGIAVIEDCAHAHGAEYKGRKVGTIGRINCFSFQQKKNLPLGEGGMITTDDDALAEKARAIRSFGKARLAYNYRMSEFHAAIGLVRLANLDAANAIRIENAQFLYDQLANIPGLTPQKPLPDTKCVYYNFLMRYEPETFGLPRNRFIEAVNAEGVLLIALYYPLHRDQTFRNGDCFGQGCPFTCPYYKAPQSQRPNYADGSCPVSEEYCDHRNVEIKVHPPATKEDLADVVAAIKKVIENIDELKN